MITLKLLPGEALALYACLAKNDKEQACFNIFDRLHTQLEDGLRPRKAYDVTIYRNNPLSRDAIDTWLEREQKKIDELAKMTDITTDQQGVGVQTASSAQEHISTDDFIQDEVDGDYFYPKRERGKGQPPQPHVHRPGKRRHRKR